MVKILQGKYEYLHIDDDKLVITKTPEIEDLMADYAKSTTYFFRTLMVFFIGIPIFTVLSIFFYFKGFWALTIFAGVFGLFLLCFAFYSMIFVSMSPVIFRDKIVNIHFKKNSYLSFIQIRCKESGRIKKRGFVLFNDQIDTALGLLLAEKLIVSKNIELNGRKIAWYSRICAYVITLPIYVLFITGKILDIPEVSSNKNSYFVYALVIWLITLPLIEAIFRKLISFYYYKRRIRIQP